MPHPLAEVFGYPTDNFSPAAERHRKGKICPFNNKVPNCTKDKALSPLGVCSIFETGQTIAITCPVRFRQDWLIAEDAARFFFPDNTAWTSLTEVRLKDANGQSAGNIDVVLVAYDQQGHIVDFGSLEVQAVYISGNVRNPFEHYMLDPHGHADMDWQGAHYPRADYLSSSRKRLAPQMLYKGGIFRNWGKKQAVARHKGFYETLPTLPETSRETADVAWLVYDLQWNQDSHTYQLVLDKVVYTTFEAALLRITTAPAGSVDEFIELLQSKLDQQLGHAPDAPSLQDMLRGADK